MHVQMSLARVFNVLNISMYPYCAYSQIYSSSQKADAHMTFIGPDESRMLWGRSASLADAALHFLDSCGGI